MTFLRITLIILSLLLVTSEAGTCDDDWFGSKCQYKCRCTDNKCDDNGICKDGSKCSTGWFGPACQYADLAANSPIKQYGSSVQYDELTDGDEKTCVDVSSFKSVTMDWTTPYPFTWMRIDLHRPDRNNGFEIQFKNKSDTNIISNCNNQKMFLISPTTIDIHCDLDVAVDQVIVSWKNVQSICSLYISGGRNVALKQNTSQSSTFNSLVSSAAVNDEFTWSYGNPSCSQTKWEPSPHWNLYFTQPHVVNRYVLYDIGIQTSLGYIYTLEGFILESFASDGSLLLNHKDKQGVKDVYTVLSVGVKEPVSQVKITAANTDGNGNTRHFADFALCEVQIYGDSQCPKGQYGLECNKTCNCAKDEDCFVSTGGCPSGCPIGFYRDECREECPTSYHGVDCLESCSSTCRNQSCDRVSGKCHGCVDGKQETFALRVIVINDYPICNHMTGACNFGCLPAYKKKCESEDGTANSLGLQIGIGVTCTIILILAVVLGNVLFLLRKKNISKSDTREDDRSQDYEDDVLGRLEERPFEDVNEDATREDDRSQDCEDDVLGRQEEHPYEDVNEDATREDDRSQDYEDDVLGRQEEHPYEDVNEDADGYSRLQSSHSPGFELRERDAFDNNATGQNDSTYSHLRHC